MNRACRTKKGTCSRCEDYLREHPDEIPFIYVASRGHVGWLRKLLKDCNDVNITNRFGNTALIQATRAKQIYCVKALIKAGADVNICNNERKTALMFAAEKKFHSIVGELIEAGASVNNQDYKEETALTLAVGADVDTTKRKRTSFYQPYSRRAAGEKQSKSKCVKALTSAGAFIKIPNGEGNSALKLAEERGINLYQYSRRGSSKRKNHEETFLENQNHVNQNLHLIDLNLQHLQLPHTVVV